MEPPEILALTDVWAGGFYVLVGTIVGGLITYWIQKSQHKRERLDNHKERLRTAYGSWAGALRVHTVTYRTAFFFNNIAQDHLANAFDVKGEDNSAVLQMGRDMRDRTLAADSARANEEAAFGIIMVSDTNKARVERAQEIRNITLTKINDEEGSGPFNKLKTIEESVPMQSKALTEFLIEIARELSPHGK